LVSWCMFTCYPDSIAPMRSLIHLTDLELSQEVSSETWHWLWVLWIEG
jgi:hypothetical protein